MKRILKKAMAISLALFMCVGACPAALAQENTATYLVLGDSIAAGYGLSSPTSQSYGAIVSEENDYEYVNKAVSGDTSGDLLELLATQALQDYVASADIVSISIGGNDFLSNVTQILYRAVYLNDYSLFDAAIESFTQNFTAILAAIKELNPDVTILMQTLYNPRYDSYRTAFQYGVDGFNARIESLLSDNPGSYAIVDVGTEFDSKQSHIASDAIHPSAAGHAAIAQLILDTLDSIRELSVTCETQQKITVGNSLRLIARLNTGERTAVTWSSSDTLVAAVDDDGTVHGVSAGNVKITAVTADGYTASTAVQILPSGASVRVYSLDGSLSRKVRWWRSYSSEEMSLGFSCIGCDNARFEWKSDDRRVSVNKNGVITNSGIFARCAKITLTVYNNTGYVIATDSVEVEFYKFDRLRVTGDGVRKFYSMTPVTWLIILPELITDLNEV